MAGHGFGAAHSGKPSCASDWTLIGRLDLKAFEEEIKSVEGEGGRPLWPPQLLISVLVYAYSEGVSAVREMERMMDRTRAYAGCVRIR